MFPIIWNLLYSIESEIFYQFLRTNLNFSLKHSEICKVFNIIEKTIAGPTLCAQLMGRAQLSRPLPPSARPSGPFCDAIDLKSLKATNRRPRRSSKITFRMQGFFFGRTRDNNMQIIFHEQKQVYFFRKRKRAALHCIRERKRSPYIPTSHTGTK